MLSCPSRASRTSGSRSSTVAAPEGTVLVQLPPGVYGQLRFRWAIRAGVDLDDMHKLEQLARAAKIEFQAGSAGITLNGEDVSAAIRTRSRLVAGPLTCIPATAYTARNPAASNGTAHGK